MNNNHIEAYAIELLDKLGKVKSKLQLRLSLPSLSRYQIHY